MYFLKSIGVRKPKEPKGVFSIKFCIIPKGKANFLKLWDFEEKISNKVNRKKRIVIFARFVEGLSIESFKINIWKNEIEKKK